jgi:hypothetical protein
MPEDDPSKAPSLSKIDEGSIHDDSHSTSGLSTSKGGKKENEEEQVEARCLSRSRIAVLVLLTVMAAIAGALTFVVSTEEKEDDFESRVRS